MSSAPAEPKLVFEFQTIQASMIYKILDAIKDILIDANMICTKDGIKICTMNQDKTILAHLKLEADKFDRYFCEGTDQRPLNLGLSIQYLFKIIKNNSNSDVLTWRVWDTNLNELEIILSNTEKGHTKMIKLNLLDLGESRKTIPPVNFDAVITIPSQDFQKVCRDLNHVTEEGSEEIEIKAVENQLIFQAEGGMANMKIVMDFGNSDKSKPNGIVQGYYSLKDLSLFMKAANLCNNIEMYLKNDFPLIIQCKTGSLGYLKLALSPTLKTKGAGSA